MEISHHIRGKTMGHECGAPGKSGAGLSKDAAVRLVTAKNESDRQAAVLDGHFYFNGEPFLLYLTTRPLRMQPNSWTKTMPAAPVKSAGSGRNPEARQDSASSPRTSRSSAPPTPPRDTSPEALAKIQAADQKMIDLVAQELDPQAHFVSYAPPAVIAFRKGAYLEFSVNTTLPARAAAAATSSLRSPSTTTSPISCAR